MKNAQTPTINPVLFLLLAIVGLVVAWLLSYFASSSYLRGLAADSPERQQAVETRRWYCNQFATLGACHDASSSAQDEQPAINERKRAASLPDLSSALSTLQWQGGDEAEAARMMSIIKALELGRYNSKDRMAQQNIFALTQQVWLEHPQLVSAADCIYCGDVADAVRELLQKQALDPQWARQLAGGIPRYFPLLGKQELLDKGTQAKLANLYAQLAVPGDAALASYVAEILFENNEQEQLKLWVSRGLNGGRAFATMNLEQLPQALLITAWRQGVSLGYDSPELTAHLLGQGYRPALRWLLWLLDGSVPAISENQLYQNDQQQYRDMLYRYVSLPAEEGPELSRYYSEHWRAIDWDAEQQQWHAD